MAEPPTLDASAPTSADPALRVAAGAGERRFPPGPAPVTRNPLSLLSYMRRMRGGAIETVGGRFEKYGDLYRAQFLGRDVYVMRHPDHIREVLLSQADCFQKPDDGTTATVLRRFLGRGLLTENGEAWRAHRKLIQPAFHPASLKSYAPFFVEAAEASMSGYRDGQALDLSREMMELTLQIVTKSLFDHRVTDEADGVADAMRVFRAAFGGIDSVLPRWLWTPVRARTDRALGSIDAMVYGMIDARGGHPTGDDLLSALIRASNASDPEERLDRTQLRDEVLTLFLAGHETTSHALTWTFLLLSRNPEVEARLHAELDEVLEGRSPTLEDLPRLPYVEQVLKEAMRIYPPAYVIPRVSTGEARIGGYDLPVGSDVVMWIYHTHHDPRWYPDPERFDPSRFEKAREATLPACAYVPFGAGMRTCVGKRFALTEAELILATLAQRLRFDADPSYRVERDAAVTLAPKGGLPVTVRLRRQVA